MKVFTRKQHFDGNGENQFLPWYKKVKQIIIVMDADLKDKSYGISKCCMRS